MAVRSASDVKNIGIPETEAIQVTWLHLPGIRSGFPATWFFTVLKAPQLWPSSTVYQRWQFQESNGCYMVIESLANTKDILNW